MNEEKLHEYRVRFIPDPLFRQVSYIATQRGVAPNRVILDALEEYCLNHFHSIVTEVHELQEKYGPKKE